MQKNSCFKFLKDSCIKTIVDYEWDRVFKITIPINEDNENSVLVIGRAPKPFELDDCVSTLGRAVKYLLQNEDELGGIKQISFAFVFPVIEYTKDALEEVFNQRGELFILGNEGMWQENDFIKNDLVIFEEMIDCSHVIFAWGEPPKELKSVFENRIHYILKGYKLVKNNCFDVKKAYTVGYIVSQEYPKNCLNWTKDMGLIEWDI